jgi:hypothetical protein
MEFDQPNRFVRSHDLMWDAQDAATRDQNHFTIPGQLGTPDYFQGLPDLDGGKLPSMSPVLTYL